MVTATPSWEGHQESEHLAKDRVARIGVEVIMIHCLGPATLLPKQNQSSVNKKGWGPGLAIRCIKALSSMVYEMPEGSGEQI